MQKMRACEEMIQFEKQEEEKGKVPNVEAIAIFEK